MAIHPTLPKDVLGRVLWSDIPGFGAWVQAHAADWTNAEFSKAIHERYGVSPSRRSLNHMREKFNALQTPTTFRRTLENRPQSVGARIDTTQRLEQDSLRQEIRRLSQRQLFYEVVGEKIIDAVNAIPTIPVVRSTSSKIPKGLTEEDAVLLLSDVQAGQITSQKESGGLGAYDTKILSQEIDYLYGAIGAIMRYHPNVRRLHIFCLGDIVEGETIFGGQLRLVDANAIQQVIFCWEQFGRFFRDLAEIFPEIHAYGVVGNHGRIGKKGEHGPLSNLDYLLYQMWKERLKPVPRITWNISESWWQLAKVQGWDFLLVHGDDTQTGAWGIPFYGVQRTKVRYRELFKNTGLPTFDYMAIAHHHEAAMFQGAIMNGSWPGSSEFSLKRLQLGGMATQKLFGVHPKHGLTWMRDINLRPLPKKVVGG